MARNSKVLKMAVLLALMGSQVVLADGIKDQVDLDTKINAPLNQIDVEYTGVDDSQRANIVVNGYDLSIRGGQNADHVLTINHMVDNFAHTNPLNTAYNLYNTGSTGSTSGTNFTLAITANGLKELNLNLDAIDGVVVKHQDSANIYADKTYQSLIHIGSDVASLNLRNTLLDTTNNRVQDSGAAHNIEAASAAEVEINSPKVVMEIAGERASQVYADKNGSVTFGVDKPLEEVTIRNITTSNSRNRYGIWAKGGEAAKASKITVATKNLLIENQYYGVNATGSNTKNPTAKVAIGTEQHVIDKMTLNNTVEGFYAQYGGQIITRANSIDLGTHNGFNSIFGGTQEIYVSDKEGEGIFIHGRDNINLNSYGLLAWYKQKQQSDTLLSTIKMGSGNLSIKEKDIAIQASDYGLVQLGQKGKAVNNVLIGTDKIGVSAEESGAVKIYANNVTINKAYDAIKTNRSGLVEIHGGNVSIDNKTNLRALFNTGGQVIINTDANDGATKINGYLDTTTQGQSKVSLHTADSFLNGNVFDATGGKTNLELTNKAVWSINNDMSDTYDGIRYVSYLDTLQIKDGIVKFGTMPANPNTAPNYKQVGVHNLKGDAGLFVMNTDLAASVTDKKVQGHSDILRIMDSSEGNHQLLINDFSKTINQSVDDGYVLLVEDKSQNGNASFTGHADLQNGGLYTRKAIITNEAPDAALGYTDVPTTGKNWYLTLEKKPVTPDKPEQPDKPDKPDTPNIPDTPNKLTDNAKQNIAFANSRYSAIWLEESTLRKRLGDIRNDVAPSGIWSEVRHGQFDSDGILNTSNYTIYELGYDRELKNTDQRKEVVGASFHYIDTDFNSMYMGHDSGINSYVFTAYDTKLFNNGNYLDLVGKVGRVKGKMNGMGTFKEDAKWSSNMYSLSAEYGRKIASSSNWYWEPQVQLRYTYLGAADYMSSQGTAANLDSVQSVIMRAGFTVGKKHNNFDYYGKVFLNHEFAGDTAYSFTDKNKDSLSGEYDFSATWLTIGGGMQWQLSKDMYAYGEVETNINGKLEKNYEWNLGLRYSFN